MKPLSYSIEYCKPIEKALAKLARTSSFVIIVQSLFLEPIRSGMFLVCLHGCKYAHRSSHVELELSLPVMFLNGMNRSMLTHLRMLVLGYQHEQPLPQHHELHLDKIQLHIRSTYLIISFSIEDHVQTHL